MGEFIILPEQSVEEAVKPAIQRAKRIYERFQVASMPPSGDGGPSTAVIGYGGKALYDAGVGKLVDAHDEIRLLENEYDNLARRTLEMDPSQVAAQVDLEAGNFEKIYDMTDVEFFLLITKAVPFEKLGLVLDELENIARTKPVVQQNRQKQLSHRAYHLMLCIKYKAKNRELRRRAEAMKRSKGRSAEQKRQEKEEKKAAKRAKKEAKKAENQRKKEAK